MWILKSFLNIKIITVKFRTSLLPGQKGKRKEKKRKGDLFSIWDKHEFGTNRKIWQMAAKLVGSLEEEEEEEKRLRLH